MLIYQYLSSFYSFFVTLYTNESTRIFNTNTPEAADAPADGILHGKGGLQEANRNDGIATEGETW
jgi:hypothetical protein